jgi:hypothetical protein
VNPQMTPASNGVASVTKGLAACLADDLLQVTLCATLTKLTTASGGLLFASVPASDAAAPIVAGCLIAALAFRAMAALPRPAARAGDA